jgi:hypothetical protein
MSSTASARERQGKVLERVTNGVAVAVFPLRFFSPEYARIGPVGLTGQSVVRHGRSDGIVKSIRSGRARAADA